MSYLNILIIDDNENNLYTLECTLKQAPGVEVFKTNSGRSGIEILRRESIHLIIVDIQMPVMNGFEFSNYVSSQEDLKNIPIIFLTAYFKSEEFASRGYKLGAFDYLTKPIDEHRLLNKITLYSQLKKKEDELKKVNVELNQTILALKDANLELKKLKGE